MKKTSTFILVLLTLLSTQKSSAQICIFPGEECCGEGITNFQLNGTPAINRNSTVSENGGFTNTGLTTTVVAGQTYVFSVTFPLELNIVNCNTYNFKIYADLNHDNSLTDPGEELASLTNIANGTHTGSLTIPATALAGNAYMRIMMKMAANSSSGGFCGHTPLTPCNLPADPVGFHGEVENYTLNIISTSGIGGTAGALPFSVYPNPALTELFVSFYLEKTSEVSAAIYNAIGEKVYSLQPEIKSAGNNVLNVDLSKLNLAGEGIYFIELKSEDIFFVKKFILMPDPEL